MFQRSSGLHVLHAPQPLGGGAALRRHTLPIKICREFSTTFLAGTVLNSLSECQVRHETRDT